MKHIEAIHLRPWKVRVEQPTSSKVKCKTCMLNDHIKENHGEMRIEALEELILDEEIALVGENTLEEFWE